MEQEKRQFRYQTKDEYYAERIHLESEISKIDIKIAEIIQLLEDFKLETANIEQEIRNYKIKSILYTLSEIILAIIMITNLFGSVNLFVFIPAFLGMYMIPIKTLQEGLALHKKLNSDGYNVETRRALLNLEDMETLIHERELMTTKWKNLIYEMNLFVENSHLESDTKEEVKSSVMSYDSEELLKRPSEEKEKQLVLGRKRNG